MSIPGCSPESFVTFVYDSMTDTYTDAADYLAFIMDKMGEDVNNPDDVRCKLMVCDFGLILHKIIPDSKRQGGSMMETVRVLVTKPNVPSLLTTLVEHLRERQFSELVILRYLKAFYAGVSWLSIILSKRPDKPPTDLGELLLFQAVLKNICDAEQSITIPKKKSHTSKTR